MFHVTGTLNGNVLTGRLTLNNAGAQTELRGLSVPHSESDFRWIYCTPGAPYSETQPNGRDWLYARASYDLNALSDANKHCLMYVIHSAIVSGNCPTELKLQCLGRAPAQNGYGFGSINSNGDFMMSYPVYVAPPPVYDSGGGG